MKKGKFHDWKDVEVILNGEVLYTTSVTFLPTKEELELELSEAEANEDYERCIELRNFIKEHYNH